MDKSLEAMERHSKTEPMAKLLGFELLDLRPGYAKVAMTAGPETSAGNGRVAGGALFALMDDAFQYACNSHGQIAVAQQINIYFLDKAQVGGRLIAEVEEINRTRKTALYDAKVWDQDSGCCLVRAQASAFRLGKPLPLQ